MAEKDSRTYIRVHDGMPDHPKIDGLSDGAFRLLVTMWCWCSRHLTDGLIPGPTWLKRGTLKSRGELVSAGLVDLTDDGMVRMHDYTDHQRTAEEVEQVREARSKSGEYGNHVKWHSKRGIVDPDCDHCSQSDRETVANASQRRSQNDRKSSLQTQTETEVLTNVSTLGARIPRTTGKGTRLPEPFAVDEAMKEWAVERGMQPQWVLAQTERFVNYWLAMPGQKGVKTDWRATWRNWLLKGQDDAPAYSAPAATRKHVPLSVPDHIDPDDGPAYAAWLRSEAK